MEGGAVVSSLTPSLLFWIGLMFGIPFLMFYVVLKVITQKWDREWLLKRRERYGEQFRDFVESFDRTAQRLVRLTRRLAILLAVAAGVVVLYVGAAIGLNVLDKVGQEVLLLSGLLWLLIAPLLGLRLLAVSFTSAGARIRQILQTDTNLK